MRKYLVELDGLEMDQIQDALSKMLYETYLLQEQEMIDYEELELLINKLKSTKPIGKSNILAT